MPMPPTVSFEGDARSGAVVLIAQTRLPEKLELLKITDLQALIDAIQCLDVRGAPALGVAGAYGCVIALRDNLGDEGLDRLANARPTAVNLRWAVERVRKIAGGDPEAALKEARAIHAEDEASCRSIGEHGAELIRDGMGVLTHCNAGALATGGMGTALAPMYVAHEEGRKFSVFADETRPLLQGARLTAFELAESGVDVTVITDSTAAVLMREGRINLVITGADRIARNGDVANKIGTYGVAVAAKAHKIPFYVAAPRSTFDGAVLNGDDIPIEQRSEDEIRKIDKIPLVPKHAKVYNSAFDVTPADHVAGYITEAGLFKASDLDGWLG
jgi:methylthioribose-1-phosphate isomerase